MPVRAYSEIVRDGTRSTSEDAVNNGAVYGDQAIYERDCFTCAYCGFDGRAFENWMQLTIDHVIPSSQGGSDADFNKVVACHSCNTLTCKYPADPSLSPAEVLAKKRIYVRDRLEAYHRIWIDTVAPRYHAAGPFAAGRWELPVVKAGGAASRADATGSCHADQG